MMPHRRLSLHRCCAVTCICVLSIIQVSAQEARNKNPSPQSLQTTKQPFHGHTIANFLNHRCGSTFKESAKPSIWTYEGTLSDPLSGKVIAGVEGLELVKQLPTMTSSSCNSRDMALLNNLRTKNILFPKQTTQSSQPSWDTATTILSRKLFCYRRPSSMNDAQDGDSEFKSSPRKSLLTSIRLRPDGPLRHLSPLENMAVYDSAITYITRNNGREMVVFTELGGGKADDIDGYDLNDGKMHYVMGSAQCGRDATSFSFAIQALKGTSSNKGDHGPMLPPLKHPSSDGSNEVVISPPRSRLLQFGKGDGSNADGAAASERKYRTVRESYSYSMHGDKDTSDVSEQTKHDNTSRFDLLGRVRKQKRQPNPTVEEIQTPCTVKYTRYGEAPPWYAPGRMCSLELHGKRLSDDMSTTSQAISPLLSWASSKCKPSFWSGWPAISSSRTNGIRDNEEHALAQQAIRLFSNESRRFILPSDHFSETEGRRWASASENALSRVHIRLKRLSKSVIVSKIPR